MDDQAILSKPEKELENDVSAALRNYSSLLELSRSPLAQTSLVTPALVLTPCTPDDYGRALRIALRWAVNRLAPAPPRYPIGQPRPFDDPTWLDPGWWRYNILRHLYLEPLLADYDPEAGLRKWSRVNKLVELTGISSESNFFDVRSRAIHEVTHLLRSQIIEHHADAELRRMAVQELYDPLSPAARAMLELASTFRGVLARRWLLQMAEEEQLNPNILDELIAHRLIVEGDGGDNLLLPPPLQEYAHACQLPADARRRHAQAARFYLDRDQPLELAWHLSQCGRHDEAAAILLESANALINELQGNELREALAEFKAGQLSAVHWCEIQLLLSDLWRDHGNREAAIEACRRALRATNDPTLQARSLRRQGKLYEDHNPAHALAYYQQAADKFRQGDPEWLDLLKDRAWLYIKCHEWEKAEADLQLAMHALQEKAFPDAASRRADIHDALASLHRKQKHYDLAVAHAQQALALREEIADPARIADSCNNLGNLYVEMGQFNQARASYEEALASHRKLGNRERIANAHLNIGTTFFHTQHYSEAIEQYQESLKIYQEIQSPRGEAQAYYNIAEALARQNKFKEAAQNWQKGYALSQQDGLVDQVEWFERLRAEYPALETCLLPMSTAEATSSDTSKPDLTPTERLALEIAREKGYVTRSLMLAQANISESTAKNTLTRLTRRGLLTRVGQGRGICYVESR